MLSTILKVRADDGLDLYVYEWLPENGQPMGIVQIAHGMVEHAGRYRRFAEALTSHGLAVYANDHRGHGETSPSGDYRGHFADVAGWERVTDDMKQITDAIIERHPGRPIILFGHSIGSFLSRRYAQKYGRMMNGLILSGTGGDPGLMGALGLLMAKREVRKRGPRGKSELMNQLIFGGYNKKFKPTRTPFDWLSRDQKEVDAYIDDPHCGFIVSATFYKEMIEGLQMLDRPERLRLIPIDLPILLISGEQDPVGSFGKGVRKVYHQLKDVGIYDVTMKLYEGARHELLNEINRDEVTEDMITWIKNHT